MAAFTGDIIRITDRQRGENGVCLNVYFYQVLTVTELAGDYLETLGEAFRDQVVVKAQALQDLTLVHESLFMENLTNGVDIKEVIDGFPLAGSSGSDNPMPPFVSLGFEMFRSSRLTRNGYKRLAGVPEDSVTNGVYSGSMTPIHAYEGALDANITVGIVEVLTPVIVKHPITVPLVSPVISFVVGAQFKSVGSQNTRKFNRGV